MKTARKGLRILCIALCVCIIFALTSCGKSEDTCSYIDKSDLSKVFDTSDEVSNIETSDISDQGKDLVFTLTEVFGTECYAVSGFTGDESVSHVDIPSHVNGLPVMIIDYGAFFGCSGLRSITIPDSVISIGEIAFFGCSGLTSITIPDSVSFIGYLAFANCTGLTSITIPSRVSSITKGVFGGCTGLESMSVSPENKKYRSVGNCIIESQTNTLIAGCKNTVIPTDGSVKRIGADAFDGCVGLTDITIPDCVISIGENAFADCKELKSITIPNSVISIGENAFARCSGLNSLTIPESVIGIGEGMISHCTSLESLTVLPGNKKYHSEGNCIIETKNRRLIAGCKTSVIPDDGSVTSIGAYAFSGLSNVIDVILPDEITGIGKFAFEGCTELRRITIPDGVVVIASRAFQDCTGLTDIIIPGSVSSIGEGAFFGCTGLENISVSPENKTYYSVDNCIIEPQTNTLIAGCKNTVIPTDGSVKIIGEEAFSRSSITSAIIPDSVTNIDDMAFWSCTALTSVTIPSSVIEIGWSAFDGCTSLTSITFGGAITQWKTFSYNLKNVVVECTDGDVIYDVEGEAIYIKDSDASEAPDTSDESSISEDPEDVETPFTTFTFTLTEINGTQCYAVYEYLKKEEIASAIIPSHIDNIPVTAICYNAFGSCKGLTGITIPDSVTDIGEKAFISCVSLTSLHNSRLR